MLSWWNFNEIRLITGKWSNFSALDKIDVVASRNVGYRPKLNSWKNIYKWRFSSCTNNIGCNDALNDLIQNWVQLGIPMGEVRIFGKICRCNPHRPTKFASCSDEHLHMDYLDHLETLRVEAQVFEHRVALVQLHELALWNIGFCGLFHV